MESIVDLDLKWILPRQGTINGVRWKYRFRQGNQGILIIGNKKIPLKVAADGAVSTHLLFGEWKDPESVARKLILDSPNIAPKPLRRRPLLL